MAKGNCCQSLVLFFTFYVAVPLGLPLICIVAIIARLHDKFTFEWFQTRRLSSPEKHRQKVAKIQGQVKEWHSAGRKSRMCTAKPLWNSWNVHGLNKRNLSQINVDELTDLVELDEVNRVLTVEPGVMMGQLTTLLISRGWTIPVVPEFETLTVGGTVCGTGVESNSCRWGFSADFCLEYEVVLSNGDVVTCSKDQNSDLFHSIPWSHGTLGFLTAVKIPLIPAKKYVQLEYHVTDSPEEAQRLLETQDHEFVEGLAFGPRKFVVSYGNMADKADPKSGPVNHINRWYKPFFYKHMESMLRRPLKLKGNPVYVDCFPLRDYYHRHTRAFFWTLPLIQPYVNRSVVRFLLGWMLPGNPKFYRRLLLAFIGDRVYNYIVNFGSSSAVLQDFVVPIKKFRPWLDLLEETVAVYPLWLCPCKFFKKPGMVHSANGENDPDSELYFDLGVYGITKKDDFHPELTIRKLEDFTIKHGGVQFLYTDSFLSRDEFRKMFDMSLYDSVRAKYQCLDAFPDVYDKVSKSARQIEV